MESSPNPAVNRDCAKKPLKPVTITLHYKKMNAYKSEAIAKLLESITPLQRDLLKAKFGITLSENMSPEEFVEALSKITHEKIESIEREALEKLRDKGAPDGSK